MENASKALIIAGAILLSILIIALGMRIYNSSTSSAANADLSATEIASFNSTFEAYSGAQKGTAVKQLITAIRSSNAKNSDDRKIKTAYETGDARILGVEPYADSDENAIDKINYNKYEDNKTYTVRFDYNTTTGLIQYVIIK